MIRSIHYLLILTALCGSSISAHAQDYLVTTTQDTLRGKVSILIPGKYSEQITIRTNKGQDLTLVAQQITYAWVSGQMYRTIKYGEKYRIMQVIEPGYLGLYAFRFQENYSFGMMFLYKVTGEGMEIPTFNFRSNVSDFLEECTLITFGLEQKKYTKSNLPQLVKDYNSLCVDVKEVPVLSLTNTEMAELMSDIRQRMEANQTVPEYMIKALEESNQATPDKEATSLLKELRGQ